MNYADRLSDDRFVIFIFHGVIDKHIHSVRNYIRKHIERDFFIEVLGALKERGHAVTLRDVVAASRAGERLPPRSFVITFDDGFENNYSIAAPVLADMGLPATFFVTTEYVALNRMSWPDRIELAFESAPPGSLIVPWGVESFSDTASRRALIEGVRKYVKSFSSADGQALATDIQKQLGCAETWSLDGQLDLKLSWKQTRQLNNDPLFDVGGHSHTHQIMSFLSPDQLDYEVMESLRLLKNEAGVSPALYSYPEGLSYCYSTAVIERLQRAGVEVSPSAEDGDNDETTGLFDLKRVFVV